MSSKVMKKLKIIIYYHHCYHGILRCCMRSDHYYLINYHCFLILFFCVCVCYSPHFLVFNTVSSNSLNSYFCFSSIPLLISLPSAITLHPSDPYHLSLVSIPVSSSNSLPHIFPLSSSLPLSLSLSPYSSLSSFSSLSSSSFSSQSLKMLQN